MSYFADLPDTLDELLNSPTFDPKTPPASYKAPSFTEPCSKCRGTGRFTSYSGRVLGQCFACKGAGKFAFKTSPETRAANREQAANRKAVVLSDKIKAFKAAYPAVYAWIQETSGTFDFATAMDNALVTYGSLTERQIAACERCIAGRAKAQAARVERQASAPEITVERIEQAFAAAKANGKKDPLLRLDTFVFSLAKANSRNPGAIYVKENGEYLGKVAGGKFICVAACGDEREAKIIAAAANPEAAAVAYGKRTSSCSCCGLELTNPVSIERGIGPICAEKYGW